MLIFKRRIAKKILKDNTKIDQLLYRRYKSGQLESIMKHIKSLRNKYGTYSQTNHAINLAIKRWKYAEEFNINYKDYFRIVMIARQVRVDSRRIIESFYNDYILGRMPFLIKILETIAMSDRHFEVAKEKIKGIEPAWNTLKNLNIGSKNFHSCNYFIDITQRILNNPKQAIHIIPKSYPFDRRYYDLLIQLIKQFSIYNPRKSVCESAIEEVEMIWIFGGSDNVSSYIKYSVLVRELLKNPAEANVILYDTYVKGQMKTFMEALNTVNLGDWTIQKNRIETEIDKAKPYWEIAGSSDLTIGDFQKLIIMVDKILLNPDQTREILLENKLVSHQVRPLIVLLKHFKLDRQKLQEVNTAIVDIKFLHVSDYHHYDALKEALKDPTKIKDKLYFSYKKPEILLRLYTALTSSPKIPLEIMNAIQNAQSEWNKRAFNERFKKDMATRSQMSGSVRGPIQRKDPEREKMIRLEVFTDENGRKYCGNRLCTHCGGTRRKQYSHLGPNTPPGCNHCNNTGYEPYY